eukprot:474366-Ditylum_brightwellii.AAC.1
MQSHLALMQQAAVGGFNFNHPSFGEMMGGANGADASNPNMKNVGQQRPPWPASMPMLPQLAAQAVSDCALAAN